MKRLFGMFIAMLIIVSGASAEDALPYFEKHGVEILYIDEPVTAVLDECIVFYNDTYAEAYPCNMMYEVTRDDIFGGKRYLNLRVTAGMYDLPELEHNTMAVMFYALRDYYTGTLFDIGTELYERGTTMYDFIVEYGDYSWEIKAGVTINTYYPENGIEFVFNYQLILDEDYNGLVFCNEPVFEYSDVEDFAEKLEHTHHENEPDQTEFNGIYAMVK